MTVEEEISLPGRVLKMPNRYHDKFMAMDYCQVVETKDGELLVKFDRLRDAVSFHSVLQGDASYADYTELLIQLPVSTFQYNPRLMNFGVVRVDDPSKTPIHGLVRYRSQVLGAEATKRRQFLEFEDIDDAAYTVSSNPHTMSLEAPNTLERHILFSPSVTTDSHSHDQQHQQSQEECQNSNSRYYKIDLQKVEQGVDQRTTCMIRNIPNKYTQTMLIEWLNETYQGQYDFLYLRMDFRNRCNVGYAFINFIDYRYYICLNLSVGQLRRL